MNVDTEYTITTKNSFKVLDRANATALTSKAPASTPRTRSELMKLNVLYDKTFWVLGDIDDFVRPTGSFLDRQITTATNLSSGTNVNLSTSNCIYTYHQKRSGTGTPPTDSSFKINVATVNGIIGQYRLHLPIDWLTT